MIDILAILGDKQLKGKAKTEWICQLLLDQSLSINELIEIARTCKDSDKATCIEAIEFATKKHPDISTLVCLDFMSVCLSEKAPRIKWESAKVIGNIAHLYPDKLKKALQNLLINSENSGTVVRWSAAFALGEIIKLESTLNKDLIPALESICLREEKNSIRKIYQAALKKVSK